MQVVNDKGTLRYMLSQWRQQQQQIALVPTMGNLHTGHLALVKEAKKYADKVVVSIFVNPLQFGENEDLAAYPRTLDTDKQKLEAEAVDILFFPPVQEMYAQSPLLTIHFPGLDDKLCGQSRPGHFSGVAIIVAKLFHIVQPDIAIFGEKDYQQLLIIKQMVMDLDMSVMIYSVPIIREDDGLAMSSRNRYLSPSQRQQAPQLQHTLLQIQTALSEQAKNFPLLHQQASKMLQQQGWKLDYLALYDAKNLAQINAKTCEYILLIAAYLGTTRLIDNRRFTLSSSSGEIN